MRNEKKHHYIYKTTNILSGRYYLGMHSTNNLDDGYLGSGTYLRRALNKHGKENFAREILEFCKTRKELKSREADIVNLQEIAKMNCMNLRVGGSGEDYKSIITTETRKKMSNSALGNTSALGNIHNADVRKKISEAGKGRECSVETRCKLSEAIMGHSVSEETRKKISESNIGNYHTDVTKEKLRISSLGRTHSMKTRKKISDANKNPSDEIRKKMSEFQSGKVTSEETKIKIGIANSKPQKKVKCPYCNQSGGITNMKRYHFDNCKYNVN